MTKRTTAFTERGLSFRPSRDASTGLLNWSVHRKRERGLISELGFIRAATDGKCYLITGMTGHVADARPSFEEACDLVRKRLTKITFKVVA